MVNNLTEMKKRILLVTGRNAKQAVEHYARKSKVPVRIHSCKENVAALLSPKMILDELSRVNLDGISLILVPGLIKGNLSIIDNELKIPCFKGPGNVVDLPYILERISKIKLSTEIPADKILKNDLGKRIDEELKKVYEIPEKYSLKIGKKNPVFLGTGISHIIAEIPDVSRRSDREIRKIARYYADSGAEIIDLGMIPGEDNSGEIPRVVSAVKKSVGVPVSIDTLNVDEILAGVKAGVDLILSLDMSNYRISSSFDVPAVVIPRNERGRIPKEPEKRILLLEELIKKLERRGFGKIIIDPVLDPPNFGLIKSLETFIKFRNKYPNLPMMLGSGNVTEMMDADSIGVNALLCAMASELEIDLIFTTEASAKTRGTIKEISTAAKMMYLSMSRNQAPKDLGIDLLCLKDKRRIENIRTMKEKKIRTIKAIKTREPELEGIEFRIYLSDEMINAVYYKNKKPMLKLVGKTAGEIYKEIINRNLIESLEHSAYLGKELEKAEIALKLGKNYVQDEDLF